MTSSTKFSLIFLFLETQSLIYKPAFRHIQRLHKKQSFHSPSYDRKRKARTSIFTKKA